MEKRKAYILAAFTILILLTGLAFWYLYTTKQESSIGEVTELDLYGVIGQGLSQDTDESEQGVGQVPTSVNDIIQPNSEAVDIDEPESWRLVQIHPEATVGATVIDEVITFIEQKTGNILESVKGAVSSRLSGTVIQYVQNAYHSGDDSLLVLRGERELPLTISLGDTATSTIEYGLYDTVLQITQVPEQGGELYYTTPNDGIGVSIRPMSNPSKSLWSSTLTGLLLQATTDSLIITQKASYNIPGYAYTLPQEGIEGNDGLVPLLQDLPGLITNVSPDGQQVLYSTSGTVGLELFLQDTLSGFTIPLSITTLASKCAWSIDNITFYCALPSDLPSRLPDNWYKGQVHFADDLWRIDSQSGDAFELAHGTNLDIIELQEDTGKEIIIFKNKTDQTLWSVIKN